MNSSELKEIRKRFKYENDNISNVVGCYVNESKTIISRFRQDMTRMGNEEGSKALAALKKVLSGKEGSNGYDIEFETSEVANGQAHKLLMDLRESKLQNDELIEALFQTIAHYMDLEGNYIIMMCYDGYDVPSKDRNDEYGESEELFRYITCCICPVKQPNKPLTYSLQNEKFQDFESGWQVAAPEAGFVFPSFDNRSTNIYNAHYYAKTPENIHIDLIRALFNTDAPQSSADQKEAFREVLREALSDDCDMEMFFGIQDRVNEVLNEQNEAEEGKPKRKEKVKVNKSDLVDILRSCGADEEQTEIFEERYEELFGEDASVPAENLIERKKMKVETPDIVISVPPDKTSLIETRIIDNQKYILIKANEGVTINGFDISINE